MHILAWMSLSFSGFDNVSLLVAAASFCDGPEDSKMEIPGSFCSAEQRYGQVTFDSGWAIIILLDALIKVSSISCV